MFRCGIGRNGRGTRAGGMYGRRGNRVPTAVFRARRAIVAATIGADSNPIRAAEASGTQFRFVSLFDRAVG